MSSRVAESRGGIAVADAPRDRARGRVAPLLLVLLGVLCAAGSVTLDLVTTEAQRAAVGSTSAAGLSLPGLILILAAAVVLRERPGDPVGRLLGLVAVVWTVDGVLSGWTVLGHARDLPGTDVALWFVGRFGAVLLTGLVALLLVYPDGRLLPGRARPLSVVVLAASAGLPVALQLAPDRVVFSDPRIEGVDSGPLALPLSDAASVVVLVAGQLLTFGSLLAAVVLLWVRHRGAGPAERLQLRWLLWAGIMCVLLVLASPVFSVSGPVTAVLLDAAVVCLAVSLAIGLVRPGLGDVDALVAWTLTSAAVAAVVVAFDLAVLAVAGSLLGERLDERGVTVAVLVLAVVVYGPLRARIGATVRRLLFGGRGDRYGAVSSLAARLEAAASVAEQLPALVEAIATTFKVPWVRVEVVAPDGGLLSASHGREPAERQDLDIGYRGEHVGRLALPVLGLRAMLSGRDQDLLVDLVRQAAIAIRSGLLAAELQTSRERLVLGREEDRRRIRRDLHDGLGPVLGGVALRLQAAENAIAEDPERAGELVRLARGEVREALDDVRRLVHDLRPPALDDLGLEAALRHQADRLRGEVDVDLRTAGVVDLPAAVEVAVYRIVSEALTNVVRHAGARRAWVTLETTGTTLRVEVRDDGRGIADDVMSGVGLRSLRERADELGGRCEVVCPPEGGTQVTAHLPLPDPGDDALADPVDVTVEARSSA